MKTQLLILALLFAALAGCAQPGIELATQLPSPTAAEITVVPTATTYQPAPTAAATPTLIGPATSSKPSSTIEMWSSSSPDGKWIAEGMREAQREPCQYRTSLTVTSADGAVLWKVWEDVQNCGLGSTNPIPFHWSQDGRSLYFTNEPMPDGCAQFVNGSDLYRVDLMTGRVTQLMPHAGLWLALSPDETQLAYIAYGSRGLVIRDLISEAEREVKLPAGAQAGHMVWSPDQTMLMLTLDEHGCGGAYSVGRVEAQASTLTILLRTDTRRFITRVWPEAGRVLLADSDGNLWWMEAQTGELTAP